MDRARLSIIWASGDPKQRIGQPKSKLNLGVRRSGLLELGTLRAREWPRACAARFNRSKHRVGELERRQALVKKAGIGPRTGKRDRGGTRDHLALAVAAYGGLLRRHVGASRKLPVRRIKQTKNWLEIPGFLTAVDDPPDSAAV